MISLKEFFNDEDSGTKGILQKNNILKRKIVAYMAARGYCTIAELTKHLHISVPTITKLIHELQEENIVMENGKVETAGGRRPSIYGLTNTAIYFAGVEVNRKYLTFVIIDLKNNIIFKEAITDFRLEDSDTNLEFMCNSINKFIDSCGVERNKIMGLGVCITGRVNPETGHSYNYYTSGREPLSKKIENRTGIRVLIENDVRAWSYAEYITGNLYGEKNVICLYLGRGVATGIIMDGKLFYGKSGFAGEFGHIPFFDNEIICSCGKKGCLETETSGIAIEKKLIEQLEAGRSSILEEKYRSEETIFIDDIIEAAHNDDNLSIELIGEAAEKIGRSIAYLINIFNPEVIILGGNLSKAGDYVMLPIKSATHKYSLSLVFKDTEFRPSHMSKEAGALGAAMLIRDKIIEI